MGLLIQVGGFATCESIADTANDICMQIVTESVENEKIHTIKPIMIDAFVWGDLATWC